MISLTWLKISLCIATAYASQNDPRQYFAQSTPSPIALKPGYAMKDVILYLTPSQIRALEATQGLNKVVPYGKPSQNQNENIKFSEEDLQKLEAELNRQLEYLRIYEKKNQEVQVQEKAPPPIVEPNTEKPIPFAPDFNQEQQKIPQAIQQPEFNYYLPNEQEQRVKLPESYSYIKFFTDNVAQEKSKVQVFQPFPHDFKVGGDFEKTLEIHKDPIHQKQYKLIPYAFSEKSPEQLKQELISQVPQFPNLFSQLHSEPSPNLQFADLIKAQNQDLDLKNLEVQKGLSESDIRYAAKFEDHKQASDFQRFVAKIQKENALAQAEALKKTSPEIIKKEESITKFNPSQFFKHSINPQLKPFYVTGPLSFKSAQPYQIPIKVIQAFPTPKTLNFEVPKGDLEIERYVPAELKKNEQFEISANSDKSTTFRHVWKH